MGDLAIFNKWGGGKTLLHSFACGLYCFPTMFG